MSMKGGMLAVSAASKVANKVKEDRQKSKAKLEDETRRVVASFWTSLEKGEDDVLNRAEYRQVVETLEPDSMPLDEETMDELVAQCTGGLVRKDEVVRVLIKARSYLKAKRELEALYFEYDKDRSGAVSKDELLPMMRASVASVRNFQPESINDDDVEELWMMSDTDGNGSITKAELLLSLSTWRDRMKAAHDPDSVAKESVSKPGPAEAVEEKKKSSACVLL